MSAEFLRRFFQLPHIAKDRSVQKEPDLSSELAHQFLVERHLQHILSVQEALDLTNIDAQYLILLSFDWQRISVLQPKKEPDEADRYYIHYEATVPPAFTRIHNGKNHRTKTHEGKEVILKVVGGNLCGWVDHALQLLRRKAIANLEIEPACSRVYAALLEKFVQLDQWISPVTLRAEDRELLLFFLETNGHHQWHLQAVREVQLFEEEMTKKRNARKK